MPHQGRPQEGCGAGPGKVGPCHSLQDTASRASCQGGHTEGRQCGSAGSLVCPHFPLWVWAGASRAKAPPSTGSASGGLGWGPSEPFPTRGMGDYNFGSLHPGSLPASCTTPVAEASPPGFLCMVEAHIQVTKDCSPRQMVCLLLSTKEGEGVALFAWTTKGRAFYKAQWTLIRAHPDGRATVRAGHDAIRRSTYASWFERLEGWAPFFWK